MPMHNPTERAPSKPIILTSIGQSGVSTLDLATVPHHLLCDIASAALAVAAEWGNGDITTQHLGDEGALEALALAVNALDVLYHPTIPSNEDLSNYGLTVADDDAGYPVIRDGAIRLKKAVELTAVEKAGVRQWLSFNVKSAAQSSASFKDRLTQFERETSSLPSSTDTNYVEAPAPDWRL